MKPEDFDPWYKFEGIPPEGEEVNESKEVALPMAEELAEEVLVQMAKYCSLVWYARKSREDLERPEIAAAANEVFENFPQEVADLNAPDTGDWQQGFNSGALAAFRFIFDAHEDGIESAIANFPELDT